MLSHPRRAFFTRVDPVVFLKPMWGLFLGGCTSFLLLCMRAFFLFDSASVFSKALKCVCVSFETPAVFIETSAVFLDTPAVFSDYTFFLTAYRYTYICTFSHVSLNPHGASCVSVCFFSRMKQ